MVLVICGPNERPIAREIVSRAAHPRVVSLTDPRLGENYPLPLGLSKACVRRSQLMVTTDSGPRHFAPAFDVPVITLFGPTPISLSETHFSKATHLQLRSRLRTVHAARVSAQASSLHARPDGRSGLSRSAGAASVSARTGRVVRR